MAIVGNGISLSTASESCAMPDFRAVEIGCVGEFGYANETRR